MIKSATQRMNVSPLGPNNTLPRFRSSVPQITFDHRDSLTAADRERMLKKVKLPVLPYTMQDNYDRAQTPGDIPTIVLENEKWRATFYPSMGGRLASLYSKTESRELLFHNPVLQPANLALRNAWFSGGIEWNCPVYGHGMQTMSPVFMAQVTTSQGDILRIYEYDRLMGLVWQVDACLPTEGDELWVHVTLRNPNTYDCDVYWWTNIAVPLTDETRVLCPGDAAIMHHIDQVIERVPFPRIADYDGSYPGRYPSAESVFILPDERSMPVWQAAVDGDGKGLAYLSGKELSGRKLFTWGGTAGGKHWMDFLSRPGEGNYLEIQGGITSTQLHTRPLAAGGVLEWTECFSPISLERMRAHDADYVRAVSHTTDAINKAIPSRRFAEMDTFLNAHRDTSISRVLHRGSAWGKLEEVMRGNPFCMGLDFTAPVGKEERPWHELAHTGAFSTATLSENPCSWSVSSRWRHALENSMKNGETWLHHLHLGVAELEAENIDKAEKHFLRSIELQANCESARNMAVLEAHRGNISDAWDWYRRAWNWADGNINLASEIATWLQSQKLISELTEFTEALPTDARGHERIQIAFAEVALAQGQFDTVRALFAHSFITIREGEKTLSDLWFALHRREAEAGLRRPLTEREWEEIRQKNPPPETIDFRMTMDL